MIILNLENAKLVLNKINIVTGNRKKLMHKCEFESDRFDIADYSKETDTAIITLRDLNTSGSIGIIKDIYT